MRRALLLCLLALPLCGCGVFFSEVEVPRACATQRGQRFEFPPLPPGAPSVTVAQELSLSLRERLPDDPTEAEFQVLSLTLRAREGEVSFIERLTLWALPAQDGGAEKALVVFEDSPPPGQAELTARGERTDLVPYFKDGRVRARLELTGRPPQGVFDADIEACLYARARYVY